jgi:peptide/nickel transport system permease protein
VSYGELTRYLGRRLLVLPLLLGLISLGVFALLYLAPGSVEQSLLAGRSATPEILAQIKHRYHLDQPFFTQYWSWLKAALRFNLGTSYETSEPVSRVVTRNLTPTLLLGLYGFVIAMGLGVPLGVLAAVKRRRLVDRTVVGLSVVAVSAPAFATGILLLYLFAIKLPWFPVYGEGTGFLDRLWHLALPAAALAFTIMALVVKLTRVAMIEALEQDYVTFARARGLSYRETLVKYALRNAMIPVITAAGLILGYTLTGAVLVEVTFALPGIGSTLVQAVGFKDIPTVQGIAIVLATIIVLVNLLTDITYAVVDPRIRYGRQRT